MFFNNRAIQVTFPKTEKTTNPTTPVPEIPTVDPEQIAQIATEFAVKTIGAIGVAIAANRVLGTICEIAVVAAKAKLK
jgi:hypothetical protein